ncbi:hypothetical protein ACFL0V_02700 [Nanoarchaeota archaeon]
MKKTICFSTGNLRLWANTVSKRLDFMQKLDIDGVELSLDMRSVKTFSISRSKLSWLRGLDHISIHAPNGIGQLSLIEQKKFFSDLHSIYDNLEASNIIIHPTEFELPLPRHMHFCIENLVFRMHYDIPRLKRILKHHPTTGLCLDASHAYLWSSDRCSELIKSFKKKIRQIHLSGTYRRKTHVSLQKTTGNFRISLTPLKGLDCPVVIESFFPKKDIKQVKDEIRLTRNLLY